MHNAEELVQNRINYPTHFMLILLNDNILICSTKMYLVFVVFYSKIMAAKEEKKQKREMIFLKHSTSDGVGAMFLSARPA